MDHQSVPLQTRFTTTSDGSWAGAAGTTIVRARGYAYVCPIETPTSNGVAGDRWRVYPRSRPSDSDPSLFALSTDVVDDYLRFRECILVEAGTVLARYANVDGLEVRIISDNCSFSPSARFYSVPFHERHHCTRSTS